ncbi:hypothetical protein [Stratiformator vulcanicus]|uniref:Chromosome partition protein Smc n=1 Tax=Stratiformator vulcanicus TaxID=2527980 RepID=A0A517R3M6_9PLAN|nr:hypothetical protein [Stratiformator vulcanicus]QDT38498.1 hypothetical protein Pan189_28920 [Stratiformator vulcanicus]
MTFVGKILIVVQLVLSVCFMAFAGAVYTAELNWRKDAETLQTQVDSLNTEMTQNQGDFDQQIRAAEKRAIDAEGKLAELTGDRDDLKTRLDTVQQMLDAEKTTAAVKSKLATIAEEQAEAARREAVTLREINDGLIDAKNQLNAERLKLKDDVFALERKVDILTDRYTDSLEQTATLTNILRSLGISTDPADHDGIDSSPPPIVEGKVLNIARPERTAGSEFVDVSLGSDDGLKRGHTMYIYRASDGGKYLGKVVLTDVGADRAVGKVILKPKNVTIERGDNVTTKL